MSATFRTPLTATLFAAATLLAACSETSAFTAPAGPQADQPAMVNLAFSSEHAAPGELVTLWLRPASTQIAESALIHGELHYDPGTLIYQVGGDDRVTVTAIQPGVLFVSGFADPGTAPAITFLVQGDGYAAATYFSTQATQ